MNDLTNLINALLNTILKWYYSSPLLVIIICGVSFYLYFRNKGDGDFWFGLKPLQTVEDLISSWSPRNCSKHDDYKISLHKHLRDYFGPDAVKESGSGRGRVDIMVGGKVKVAIEIKVNLQRTTEFDRLVGQSKRYECDYMVIVLCGRSHDDHLVDMLYEEMPNWVRIIEK
jgi:hypothetical protein